MDKLTNKTSVRWMIRRDMCEVFSIEKESFEYPWSEEDFLKCLRQRNCIGMVVEYEDHVIGFMIYELHKTKLHVLNFAVHPKYRRLGVGLKMVMRLTSKMSITRRSKITVEVRDSNLIAQLFFKSLKFKATKVLRQHYTVSNDDAYFMEYNLQAENTPPSANRIAQFIE